MTLGGYDRSRFMPNGSNFTFLQDTDRDLTVGLRSISTSKSASQLLPTPVLAFIDAGVSHLWLAEDACQMLQTEFSLIWNDTLQLYLINATQNEKIWSQNPNITFNFGNDLSSGGANFTIDIPYRSLNLNLNSWYPDVLNDTLYFPLRRASNQSQYTLGRAFLQHAYVTADYERRLFTVSQASFPPADVSPDLVQTLSTSIKSTGLPSDQLAGLIVGALAVPTLVTLVCAYLLRRRKFTRERTKRSERRARRLETRELDTVRQISAEELIDVIDSYGRLPIKELDVNDTLVEADGGWEGHEILDHQTHRARIAHRKTV